MRGYIGREVNMDDMIWNFSLGKCLSVKVLINKENFRFMDGFLAKWEFDFLVVKWLKCLILVGFDDIGYDQGVEMGNLGFCLILLGILKIRDWLDF